MQQDLVAGERQLVAAAGGGAVARGEVALARVRAGVLEGEAGLVGELAEVDLEGVRRRREHVDVGAGAEDAIAARGDDHGAHLGVLEAQALDRVGELDVDAEVVGVELERRSRGGAGACSSTAMSRVATPLPSVGSSSFQWR